MWKQALWSRWMRSEVRGGPAPQGSVLSTAFWQDFHNYITNECALARRMTLASDGALLCSSRHGELVQLRATPVMGAITGAHISF